MPDDDGSRFETMSAHLNGASHDAQDHRHLPMRNHTLRAIERFVTHIVAGLVGACVLALAAIGLDLFAKWVDANTLLHPILVSVLYGFEYLIFALDAICL